MSGEGRLLGLTFDVCQIPDDVIEYRLRASQLADQINAAIQRAEPIPASAYEGVTLSEESQSRLAAVEADAANASFDELDGAARDPPRSAAFAKRWSA